MLRYFRYIAAPHMSDIITIQDKLLDLLQHRTQNTANRNARIDETHMKEMLLDSTISKFCTVCKKINIDPLHANSLNVIVLMFAKNTNRLELAQQFVKQQDDSSVCLDVEAMHQVLDERTSIFNSITDWVTLLQFLNPITNVIDSETVRKNVRVRQCLDFMKQLDLVDTATATNVVAMQALLYQMPIDTPAPKMLERYFIALGCSTKDIEVKCLRVVSMLTDACISEHESDSTVLLLMNGFACNQAFIDRARNVLGSAQRDAEESIQAERHGRIQLRELVKTVHVARQRTYVQTFDSWVSRNKFSVAMSRQMQQLLYFMQVQQHSFDASRYDEHFPSSIAKQARSNTLEQIDVIDVTALIEVIQSVRVFQHNIKHLIDFRARCLLGINAGLRNNLSLAQILQLYIACYQHETVWEQCWKAVIPNKCINHTIITQCLKFKTQFAYEADAVVATLRHCHLQ